MTQSTPTPEFEKAAEIEAATPITTPRRDPVPESAKYYLRGAASAIDPLGDYRLAYERMREAFNHLENSAWAGAKKVDTLEAEVARLKTEAAHTIRLAQSIKEKWSKIRDEMQAENARLKLCIQSAAGDDLCRLTQDEIKAYTSGAVKIPPKEEFIPSCERFWEQMAAGPGVLNNCLTLAQLVAENEQLKTEIGTLRALNESLAARIAAQSELLSKRAEKSK